MTNVALVVLDTLRKDAFDKHFDWLPGVRYENAWSTSGWTVPVHGTLFGGCYPSEMGVYAKTTSLDCERPVLAEYLSESGYTTRGFSANANIADAFEFTRGFDEFHHSWRGTRRNPDVVDWAEFISKTQGQGPTRFFTALKRCVTGSEDTIKSLKLGLKMKARDIGIESIAGSDDGAHKALELIKETTFGDDEFLFMNLMEAHGPYNPPKEYQTTDIDSNPSFDHTVSDPPEGGAGAIRQAYDDCVRYLSDIYADIHDSLTIDFDYIITLSDHGEMFGQSGIWGHNYGLHPELTHVPLSIYRGEDERSTHEETVSLIDIYRTVLDLTGLDVTGTDTRGRNLLMVDKSNSYLIERYGLRVERISKLQNKGYDESLIKSYDKNLTGCVLNSGFYGWQDRNGFQTSGEDGSAATVRDRIDDLSTRLDTIKTNMGSDKEVPEDVKNRLEELGYM